MSTRYRKGERFRVQAAGALPPPLLVDRSTPEENQRAVAGLLDAEPLRVICAWCPDFDPLSPSNKGASHGMCPACAAKWK